MNDDLISRQAAIDALDEIETEVADGFGFQYEKWREHFSEMPSAQAERKKGQWEIYVISMLDGEGCRCSECGFEGAPYWDFCPNCGAKMEEDKQ